MRNTDAVHGHLGKLPIRENAGKASISYGQVLHQASTKTKYAYPALTTMSVIAYNGEAGQGDARGTVDSEDFITRRGEDGGGWSGDGQIAFATYVKRAGVGAGGNRNRRPQTEASIAL